MQFPLVPGVYSIAILSPESHAVSRGGCQKCFESAPDGNRHLPDIGRKGCFTNPRLRRRANSAAL
jgi:hypothetical protein